MATRFAFIIVALVALGGCQQEAAVSTDSLPPVTFDGPSFPVQAAPVPAPVVAKALPVAPPKSVVPDPAPMAIVAAAQKLPDGWIPTAPARPWKWIVIHHSATSFGNATIIDGWHRDKGWDELGYHFVIGNGTSSGDGQIEVGPRWPIQKWGAHTKTADNRYNDFGIGICLVGNFDVDHPTAAQLKSVATLVAYLMKTYKIPPDCVIGHGDAKPTDCPGKFMDVAAVRQAAVQIMIAEGENPASDKLAATDKGFDTLSAK